MPLNQRQIAYRTTSDDLSALFTARANNLILIEIAGFAVLSVGDNGAIWRSHNDQNVQLFDALFALLSARQDVEARFDCVLVRT